MVTFLEPVLNFKQIIDLWPSRIALAEYLGVRPSAVANMYMRDSISADYFDTIVAGARALGHGEVTHELMCKLAARGGNALR